ncbi:MAG: hypothetical protein KAX19_00695 [Candidatus Brocadiae bacterium]|nr:hypothetical protein [Candidatus Brocadiia bacterium]
MARVAPRTRQSVRAALCCVAALMACAGAAIAFEPEPAVGLPPAVAVEVLGFAAAGEGKTVQELHREALLDARRNALAQAHVALEAETHVQDMRLRGALVRSWARGYIQELRVLEAGLLPDAEPPVYRLRARALVLPSAGRRTGLLPGAMGDRWTPALVLTLDSDLPPEREAALRRALARAMRSCGIEIVEPDASRPALEARVSVATPAAADAEWTNVEWSMGLVPSGAGGFGPLGAAPREGADAPVRGHWLVTGQAGPESDLWQRVGARMALDAVRLWTTPRRTTVRFEGADGGRAQRLGAAFGRIPDTEVRVEEDGEAVLVCLPLAGDPLAAVEALLAEAGLAEQVKSVSASLTHLTLTFVPAAEPDATESTAAE